MLRTAFLAYVRVLLCVQGTCLAFTGWVVFSLRGLSPLVLDTGLLALIVTCIGLAGIVTAVLLRRGRPGAAIAAIVIEALWAAATAAASHYGPSVNGALMWQLLAVAALFLVTAAGLLLPPVRAYAGLVRRC